MDVSIIVGTAVVAVGFIFTLFCNFQAAIGPDSEYSLGWFKSTIGNLSDKYPTPFTPSGYAFSIWSVIYLWTAAWIVYILTTFCRNNRRGPVYLNPPATSLPFLLAVFLANGLNTAWLFVWDRELLTPAAIVLATGSLALYAALLVSVTRVYRYLCTFKHIAYGDLWAYRILVHNGLAIYGAWVTVASQINIAASLIYDAGLPDETTVYICLSVLAAELILYFIFDIFVIDASTRFVFMVYPTFAWALVAVLIAQIDDPSSPQFIFSGVLLGLSSVFFIIKSAVVFMGMPVVQGEDGTEASDFKFKFKQLK